MSVQVGLTWPKPPARWPTVTNLSTSAGDQVSAVSPRRGTDKRGRRGDPSEGDPSDPKPAPSKRTGDITIDSPGDSKRQATGLVFEADFYAAEGRMFAAMRGRRGGVAVTPAMLEMLTAGLSAVSVDAT